MDTIVYLGFILIALFVTLWQSTLYFKGSKYINGNRNVWRSLIIGSSFGIMFLSIGFIFWSNFEPTLISLKFGVLFYFVALFIIILIDLIVLTRYKKDEKLVI